MNPTARTSLLLGLYGCCCGSAPTETVLAVPSTVQEAKALHAPPTVTVVVARETRASGGGACGHSPVCLVLLPVLVWEVAFPPQVDVIDIAEATGATIHGEWEPDGDLLWAERREGGVARAARLLDLPELGRRLVVEGARAPLGADGQAGEFAPTTVQSQLDLVAAYRAALEGRSGRHAELLTEAVGALGIEGLTLLAEWLPKPDEAEARLQVLTSICGGPLEGEALTLRLTALGAIAPIAEPELSARGLTCALETPGSTQAPQFAAALVRPVCADASMARTDDVHHLSAEVPGAHALLLAAAQDCPRETRRTLIARAAGAPASAVAVRALIDSDPDAAVRLVPYLDPNDSADRAALFAHLLNAEEVGPTIDRLAEVADLSPTSSEADILVDAYLRYEATLLGRRDPQGTILALLARTPAPARHAALGRLSAVKEKDRRVEAISARLVLGDESVRAEVFAARGIAECPDGISIISEGELAAQAMFLAGCSCADFDAIQRGKRPTSPCSGSP
ncbi:hypothetical protein LBMAG42_06880 [Deltaproteobacteria bacterium]|nr:hypothetical protein LBMAG42_06880 [Deltaproteobacteria bacterium]